MKHNHIELRTSILFIIKLSRSACIKAIEISMPLQNKKKRHSGATHCEAIKKKVIKLDK